MNAIRFARAHTGKTKIIKFEGAYHGAHDYVMVGFGGVQPIGPAWDRANVPVSWGVPEETLSTVIQLPWNDLSLVERTLKRRSNEIAAIITEPVLMNIGTVLPDEGFLKGIQELCQKYGVVFILDEVISGFRLALGGAQEYFGLRPDLATYAKALGAGFPISAITGKKEIMENVVPGKIMHSGTYNANPLVVTAALASLTELSRPGTYKHLHKVGTMLQEGLQEAVTKTKTKGIVQGIGAGGCQLYFTDMKKISNYKDFFSTDSPKYMKFHKQLLKRGIYFHPQQYEHLFVCTEHSEEDVETAVKAATTVLRNLA